MHRHAILSASIALVLLLAGCAAAPPATKAARGSITLGESATTGDSGDQDSTTLSYAPGSDCSGSDGYEDIATGAEVDIVDGSGKVLAIGHLGSGAIADDGYSCTFPFKVSGIPTSDAIYGVKIGNQARGIVHFSKAQIFGGEAELTLGS